MKKRKLYYLEDILNLIFFYSIFLTILVSTIVDLTGMTNGNFNWKKLIFDIFVIIALILPYLFKKMFKITISKIITCCFYLIIFLSAFLGRTLNLYSKIPEFDTILHFLCGMYVAFFGITIFLLLNKGNYKNTILMFAFMICFTMFIGSMWEIFRYIINITINSAPIDGSGILDTIIDLSADFLGSIAAVLITFIVIKTRKDFPITLQIKKLKPSEVEIEEIEE